MKIYVGNLSFSTSEDALRQLFEQHVGLAIEHAMSVLDRRLAEGLRYVTLAAPREARDVMLTF